MAIVLMRGGCQGEKEKVEPSGHVATMMPSVTLLLSLLISVTHLLSWDAFEGFYWASSYISAGVLFPQDSQKKRAFLSVHLTGALDTKHVSLNQIYQHQLSSKTIFSCV